MTIRIGIRSNCQKRFIHLKNVLNASGYTTVRVHVLQRDLKGLQAMVWDFGQVDYGREDEIPPVVAMADQTPLLGISSNPVPDEFLVRGLENGLHDFISQGLERMPLLLARLQTSVRAQRSEQEEKNPGRGVVILSKKDPITGLYSREHFHQLLLSGSTECSNRSQTMACAVLHFKDVPLLDASLGQAGVNTFLRLTARRLLSTARQSDTLGRVTEDRFAIALPRCPSGIALSAVERLIGHIRDIRYPFHIPGESTPNIHVGVAGMDHGLQGNELLGAALETVGETLRPDQPRMRLHHGVSMRALNSESA
jgi:diguanylate cyclase (GGDEF)-like protein